MNQIDDSEPFISLIAKALPNLQSLHLDGGPFRLSAGDIPYLSFRGSHFLNLTCLHVQPWLVRRLTPSHMPKLTHAVLSLLSDYHYLFLHPCIQYVGLVLTSETLIHLPHNFRFADSNICTFDLYTTNDVPVDLDFTGCDFAYDIRGVGRICNAGSQGVAHQMPQHFQALDWDSMI